MSKNKTEDRPLTHGFVRLEADWFRLSSAVERFLLADIIKQSIKIYQNLNWMDDDREGETRAREGEWERVTGTHGMIQSDLLYYTGHITVCVSWVSRLCKCYSTTHLTSHEPVTSWGASCQINWSPPVELMLRFIYLEYLNRLMLTLRERKVKNFSGQKIACFSNKTITSSKCFTGL